MSRRAERKGNSSQEPSFVTLRCICDACHAEVKYETGYNQKGSGEPDAPAWYCVCPTRDCGRRLWASWWPRNSHATWVQSTNAELDAEVEREVQLEAKATAATLSLTSCGLDCVSSLYTARLAPDDL